MQSNSRARLYNGSVTWAGSNKEENFEWASMIDINFYLSNIRVEYIYNADSFVTVLAKFGGLLSTFTIVFTLIGQTINFRLLLAKTIETLYYVEKRALGIKKPKRSKKNKKLI